MHILLTNDDGIESPGLYTLAQQLAAKHRVSVIAPNRDRSGTSAAINLREELRIEQRSWRFSTSASQEPTQQPDVYTVNAAPGSCVLLGLSGGWLESPDLVVSGINPGPNMGLDTYISGTVGAARIANILGFPSIAVSVGFKAEKEWESVSTFVRFFIDWLEENQYIGRTTAEAEKPKAEPILWNINIPTGAEKTLLTHPGNSSLVQGLTFAVQDFPAQVRIDTRHQYANASPSAKDSAADVNTQNAQPEAHHQVPFHVSQYEAKRLDPDRFIPGTDIWAYRNGYISISPLTLNPMDLKDWLAPSLAEKLSHLRNEKLGKVN